MSNLPKYVRTFVKYQTLSTRNICNICNILPNLLLSSFFDAASNGNLDVEENEDKITDEL